MENQNLTLPAEVEQLAQNVTTEKRSEVQTVLNHVFKGVSKMREQLDSVVVVDPNDKTNMKLANTIRLGVRAVRLDAEKTFDAKRSEVQSQMLSYKTEDALWLKAKQTMQILTKEIEENARWKEETKERFEAEQKILRTEQRRLKCIQFIDSSTTITTDDFAEMSDEMFVVFLSGIEKAFNDKIKAEKKAEAERIAKEQAENEERERIRVENERLKAEAEEKEKQLAAERKAMEANVQKERTEAAAKLKAEQDAARIAAEKAATEKAKLEAELKSKADAEEKARKDAEAKAVAEHKANEAAEKKAANAPDKTKLIELALQIDALNLPEIKSEEAKKILADVKTLLAKVSTFIRDKSTTI